MGRERLVKMNGRCKEIASEIELQLRLN